jgi:hypothetical protein
MDLKVIEQRYAKMSDAELTRVAVADAHSLRPEAVEIIKAEIAKRGLDLGLIDEVLAQNREYSAAEIGQYAELLRGLPCPVCRASGQKLNATIAYSAKSFILFTFSRKEPVIACPTCLDKKNLQAFLWTLLLGWWGIPWGILKTPIYLFRNLAARSQNHRAEPNRTLLAYTATNIRHIETYRDDRENLARLILDVKTLKN